MTSRYVQRLRRAFLEAASGFGLILVGLLLAFQSGLVGLLVFGGGTFLVLHGTIEALEVLRIGGFRSLRQLWGSERSDLLLLLERELRGLRPGRALAATVASVAVHFAKLDGRISESEMSALRASLVRTFGPDIDHKLIARITASTRQQVLPCSEREIQRSAVEVIDYFRSTVSAHPSLRIRLLHEELFGHLFLTVFETIIGDGQAHPSPERAFDRITAYYGIDRPALLLIKRTAYYMRWEREEQERSARRARGAGTHDRPARGRAQTQAGDREQECLRLLNLKRGASRTELDRAWKQVLLLMHPDRFHGQAPEIVAEAHERFIRLRDTYENLCRQASQ